MNETVKTTSKIRLWITGPNQGGVGKTICAMLVANRAKQAGIKIALIDCDTGNSGTAGSYENWFGKLPEIKDGKATGKILGNPVRRLSILRERDLDTILELSASCGAAEVFCDLPANSRSSMGQWWRNVATSRNLDAMGISLCSLIAVTESLQAAQSAIKWLEGMNDRGQVVVCLNRRKYEYEPRPVEEVFPYWFAVDTSEFANLQVIDVPHLDDESMSDLTQAGVLPAYLNGEVRFLAKGRIAEWSEAVSVQLAKLGL